jgi:hypothetical protein
MLGKDVDDIKKDYEEGERSGGEEGGGGNWTFFHEILKNLQKQYRELTPKLKGSHQL